MQKNRSTCNLLTGKQYYKMILQLKMGSLKNVELTAVYILVTFFMHGMTYKITSTSKKNECIFFKKICDQKKNAFETSFHDIQL